MRRVAAQIGRHLAGVWAIDVLGERIPLPVHEDIVPDLTSKLGLSPACRSAFTDAARAVATEDISTLVVHMVSVVPVALIARQRVGPSD
jgi:hypothetical protein